jgi:ABC-type cobalamin/Fe3+-siderophores transport system ATPase subunit
MFRGSTWKIWDFHLHTPYSVLNNQFGDPENEETWVKYYDRTETIAEEKDIVAIGITDYFTIEGFKRVREAQAEEGRLEGLWLFPNVEFRVDKIIYVGEKAKHPKRLNMHVLFSPELDPNDIEENFLHDLEFVYENEPFDKKKSRKLKINNLTSLGEKLKKQHPNFFGRDSFEIGCMNAVVQIDQIKEILDNQFRGNYLLVLAEDNLSALDWDGQDHATRKHLIQMSHAIFSSNPKSREFYLGKNHANFEDYIDEFKSPKPCIWGCDSHGFEERFLEPDEKRYCWIKADVTWEGLKQILHEPEDRVRVQDKSPEPDKSIYTLDNISVRQTKISETLEIEKVDFDLNPNLIAVIGGRGSGKTALLDLIASGFQEGEKLKELEQSFIHRLYFGDPGNHSGNNPIQVSIRFASEEIHQFEIPYPRDDNWFERSDIIYLTQNHFDEFSANPDRLNDHIINLIFEKFSEEKREFDALNKEIDHLEKEIQKINLETEQLETEVAENKDRAQKELKKKLGEEKDLIVRIEKTEGKQEGKVDVLRNLAREQEKLKIRRRIIEGALHNLSYLNQKIDIFDEEYRTNSTKINTELANLGYKKPKSLPTEITSLRAIQAQISTLESALVQKNVEGDERLQKLEEEIGELEGINKIIAELHQKLGSINQEIKDIQDLIEDITEKERLISELDESRFKKYESIFKKFIELRMYLQSMIDKFEKGKDLVLENLNFSALVDVKSYDLFIQTLGEKVDNRSHSEHDLREMLKEIVEHLLEVMNGDKTDPDLSEIITVLKEKPRSLKIKRATTSSELYNAWMKRYFGISLDIKFNNKMLRELSMGERAIVLLKILLSLDDKPLLIDQAEEHLDNRYIYSELMPAFRDAKTKRQIIVATHNANLVVNTDAEQVIVANYENGRLFYEAGTLENTSIRETIKTLLEGGDEAFRKREEKYGYIF